MCFREVVVGGLGGSTLNPADIVKWGTGKREDRCYTLMKPKPRDHIECKTPAKSYNAGN